MHDTQCAADGTLVEHVQCIRCGYDRFGTSAAGVCPECGAPGWTRHFRGRRRVRRLSLLLLVLAALNLTFGLGVRLALYRAGVALADFRELGHTTSMSMRALRAAPYLNLVVWHLNALIGGSFLLALGALALLPFTIWFRQGRALLILAIALTLIAAAGWLGSCGAQVEVI